MSWQVVVLVLGLVWAFTALYISDNWKTVWTDKND